MASPNPTPNHAHDEPADELTTNRELWLHRAIDRYFRPLFAQLGYTIPAKVHVSVGWGAGRAGAESKDIAGQCWSGVMSEDSAPHIFISPALGDPAEVLATLSHELAHATLDPVMDHGRDFRDLAVAIGLEGRMTEVHPNIATYTEYMLMASEGGELGPYPHSAIHHLTLPTRLAPVPEPEMAGGPRQRVMSGPAPQVARWVRVACPVHGTDGFAVRTSRRAVEEGRAPLCGEPSTVTDGACGMRMIL